MRVIVADSGPLIVFARAGLVNIVREIAGAILTPEVVFAECTRESAKPGAAAIAKAFGDRLFSIVEETGVGATAKPLKVANLDVGETAAITLAIARNCPVLMDERLGRHVATLNQLTVIGSIGILLAAKRRGLIEAISPILSRWSSWGYFLSPSLIETALSAAEEMPKTGC